MDLQEKTAIETSEEFAQSSTEEHCINIVI